MPRVQDEPEIARLVGADQRCAVHHFGDIFQSLADLDVVNDGVDLRERAEDLLRLKALLERGVTLGVERLGVRHSAGHPQHDDRVGGGVEFRLGLFRTKELARIPGGKRRERRGAGGFEEVSTGPGGCVIHERIHRMT
jgi:hypothetical protein